MKIIIFLSSAIILIVFSLSKCGNTDKKWQEEVLLGNGQIMWVERTAKFTSGGELGGPGSLDDLTSTLSVISRLDVKPPPVWNGSELAPILLDYDRDEKSWVLLATYYMCDVWEEIGKPVPPYVQYKPANNGWVRVPFDKKWLGTSANLTAGVIRNQRDVVTTEYKIMFDAGSGEKYKKIISYSKCQ
jgi:hypothetical protein